MILVNGFILNFSMGGIFSKIHAAFLLIRTFFTHSKAHTDPVKVDDYLYEISFRTFDFDCLSSIADHIFRKKGGETSASCSAVRKDTLLGRNFDWAYDETLEETVCHSVHTSIYDIRDKVLVISTQESGRSHTRSL